jgi:hypothetical protein
LEETIKVRMLSLIQTTQIKVIYAWSFMGHACWKYERTMRLEKPSLVTTTHLKIETT